MSLKITMQGYLGLPSLSGKVATLFEVMPAVLSAATKWSLYRPGCRQATKLLNQHDN
jgi:hypothetical protein